MPRKDIHKDGLQTRFKPQGDVPPGAELAKRPLTVKVLVEVDTAIRALPEMSAWLRRVITEAAKVELLGESPAPSAESPAVNPGAEPAPGAHSGEPSPAGAELDTQELVQLVDELLAIPRLPKLAKENLLKLRERLTP